VPSFSPFVHPDPPAGGKSNQGERFEIRGKLGAGALGVVYRAFDRQRGTEVALKTLREVTGSDLYRFKREFRTLADIVHPNLVTLHELHTLAGDWLLTMELVEGVAFVDWVRPQEPETYDEEPPTGPGRDPRDQFNDRFGATGPTGAAPTPTWLASARQRIIAAELQLPRLESAIYQLVDTVHALHQAGKLHRDLKPSNVLVEASGRVVVLDFGLVADVNPASPEMTHTASAVGTPAYMSPEQAADATLTPASDWFSVGVMLYESLTGRRPVDVVGKRIEDLARLPAPHVFDASVPARLDALCMQLLALDPARRPGGDEILAALGREPSPASRELVRNLTAPPFVGREAELTTLRQSLEEVRAGKGVAVFVRGASGMGKSALLRQFLDEAAIAHGTVVLKGRCYERESVPFKTLDAIIDALTTYLVQRAPSELSAIMPRDAVALARLFPVLLRVPAVADPAVRAFLPPDPLELRRRAFGALRELLARMGQRQPVVLAIDDVQWGDADSGNFLAELLLHPDAPAMLLIVSHRSEDEDVTPLLAALRRSREALGGGPVPVPMREITLGPLADAEARLLLGKVRHQEGAWIGQVVRESGGNPMFLSELARVRDEVSHASALGDESLSLEQVLGARIGRLGDDGRALLAVCAVAARPLRTLTALRAAGMDGEGSVVTQLAAERVLRVRQTASGSELETYHDRIRTAALALLEPGQRRAVHAKVAAALEAFPDRDHEALVDHWLEAGEPGRAATHAGLAAQAAEVRLAFHRAADLYGIALAHGDRGADERRLLHVRLGHALAHAGRLDESAAAFALAAEGAAPDEQLELARLELEQLLRGGQLQVGLEKAHLVLAGIGQRLPRSTAGAITSLLGQRLSILFRRLDKTDISPSPTPPAPEVLRRSEVLWSVSSGLGFVSPILGQVLQMRYLREAVASRVPRHLGLAFSIEMGYLGIGGVRNHAKIEALRARALDIAERTGDRQLLGVAHGSAGLGAFLCGHWQESEKRLAAGGKVLRDECTGVRWLLDLVEHFHISALWYLGETRELAHLMPIYLRGAEERGDAFAQRGLRGWRGNFYWVVIDQPFEARAQVSSVSLPRGPGSPTQLTHYYELLANTQIDLYLGEAAAAHERVEEIWRDLERAMLLRIQNCAIEAWYLRARAALALAASAGAGVDGCGGRAKDRLRLALHAARRIEAQRTSWGTPLAQLVRATAARLGGDLARAEVGLRDALAGFEHAHMQLYAAAARRRLGQLIGGEDGAARIAAADAFLRAQAVGNPEAMVGMLAPGW
jgi:serine/threonine protein kinase